MTCVQKLEESDAKLEQTEAKLEQSERQVQRLRSTIECRSNESPQHNSSANPPSPSIPSPSIYEFETTKPVQRYTQNCARRASVPGMLSIPGRGASQGVVRSPTGQLVTKMVSPEEGRWGTRRAPPNPMRKSESFTVTERRQF